MVPRNIISAWYDQGCGKQYPFFVRLFVCSRSGLLLREVTVYPLYLQSSSWFAVSIRLRDVCRVPGRWELNNFLKEYGFVQLLLLLWYLFCLYAPAIAGIVDHAAQTKYVQAQIWVRYRKERWVRTIIPGTIFSPLVFSPTKARGFWKQKSNIIFSEGSLSTRSFRKRLVRYIYQVTFQFGKKTNAEKRSHPSLCEPSLIYGRNRESLSPGWPISGSDSSSGGSAPTYLTIGLSLPSGRCCLISGLEVAECLQKWGC